VSNFNDLDALFAEDSGADRMWALLRDPEVGQIVINRHDRVFFTSQGTTREVMSVFPSPASYTAWLNQLMNLTDVGYTDVDNANCSVIEGSFDPAKTDIHGSIHITTKELTRTEPGLTVRKQPRDVIRLEQMAEAKMLSPEMLQFLIQAVRGRSNILISGGSGAGKTTLIRALSWYIDPGQRIIVAEEIDELHLDHKLPNVMSLTTFKKVDSEGRIIRRVELADLVKEALRMRGDRVIVGETRGGESIALVKAANSGHDGSMTTLHADNASGAIRQLTTYVMESGLAEEVARDQVAQAFHLVIQISKTKMGRRVITEITEIEPVREGNEVRRKQLFTYDRDSDTFVKTGHPSDRLLRDWGRYGVNYEYGAQPGTGSWSQYR
jgi:pilus assembly protein CpaF